MLVPVVLAVRISPEESCQLVAAALLAAPCSPSPVSDDAAHRRVDLRLGLGLPKECSSQSCVNLHGRKMPLSFCAK